MLIDNQPNVNLPLKCFTIFLQSTICSFVPLYPFSSHGMFLQLSPPAIKFHNICKQVIGQKLDTKFPFSNFFSHSTV